MAKQIEYPADNIDSEGNVYATVGENIRSGKNGGGGVDLDALYPIGRVIFGIIPEPLKIFTWEQVIEDAPIFTGSGGTGTSIRIDQSGAGSTETGTAVAITAYVRKS